MDVTITADFVNGNALLVQYTPKNGQPTTCLEIPDAARLFPQPEKYVSVGLVLGEYGISLTSLVSFKLEELKNPLSIDESLVISHHLTDEILEKVRGIEKAISADRASLESVRDAQLRAIGKAETLDIFVRDLYQGTRRFQLEMGRILGEEGVSAQASAPRLALLRDRITKMSALHKTIGERVLRIQESLDAHRFLEIASTSFDIMDRTMDKLIQTIDSETFHLFINQTTAVADILKELNLEEVVRRAEEAVEAHSQSWTSNGWLLMGATGVLALLVWLGSQVVLSKITAAQEA
jgi:hypothetical protein